MRRNGIENDTFLSNSWNHYIQLLASAIVEFVFAFARWKILLSAVLFNILSSQLERKTWKFLMQPFCYVIAIFFCCANSVIVNGISRQLTILLLFWQRPLKTCWKHSCQRAKTVAHTIDIMISLNNSDRLLNVEKKEFIYCNARQFPMLSFWQGK